MRNVTLVLLLLAVGCSSPPPPQEKKTETTKPAPAPPPKQEDESGGITIKGSKRADDGAAPKREDPSRRNQAKIDDLKRKASEGAFTADWKEVNSQAGRFSCLFPKRPEEQVKNVDTPSGPVPVHMLYAGTEKPDARAFFVSYVDLPGVLPEADVPRFLKSSAEDEAPKLNGTVVESKAINLGLVQGREARIDVEDGTIRLRVFLKEKRVYTIFVLAPKAEADSRDLFKFIDSFRISR